MPVPGSKNAFLALGTIVSRETASRIVPFVSRETRPGRREEVLFESENHASGLKIRPLASLG